MTPIDCYVTKLLGYKRKLKAPNKTLEFLINSKIMIKIIIQVNLFKTKLFNKLAYYFIIMLALLLYH